MTGEFAVIGQPLAKEDAAAKVTGQTRYADDLSLPRMLAGKQLRSTHAHAAIRGIDVSKAQALPGVHAVLTGADLPIRYGILPVSQDETALAVDRVRYAGEPVAAVAAVDEETAERALALIEVDYEPLDAVMSIEEALDPDAEAVHEGRRGRNVHRVAALEFGDVDEGLAGADHVREDLFFYEGNTHLALEQHAALAAAGADGRLTLWSSTQVPHYLHRALARVLEMPAGRIRVVGTPVGGGFGGKCDPFSHEIVAAKLALVTGRPVKITLTREEVFYTHRGRHPVLMRLRTGFTSDGLITAMDFRSYLDGGAFGSYGAAAMLYTGALQPVTYRIPAYRFEGVRVFTTKPPCGPKRGHGTPQPRFALECHLDKAAADLGLDPVDLRLSNAIEPFSTTVNHLRVTSSGLRECIDAAVESSGFKTRRQRLGPGQGMGFAIGAYMSGAGLPIYFNDLPHSQVHLRVDRGGGVTLSCMAADIGQGSTQVLAAITAEVLGLQPGDITCVTADTDLTPVDLGSYSSRVTFMAGNAALEAAQALHALVVDAAAAKLDVPADELEAADGRIRHRGDPDVGLDWPEAVTVAEARHGLLSTTGAYAPPPLGGTHPGAGVGPSPAYSYTAAVVQVDCDADTGQVAIERVWIAHDIGRALNPLLVEGQIEGSVHMALGEALMEEQTFRRSAHRRPSLLDYKTLTALEMPDVHITLVETVDPEGPFGAKEVGQGPLLPVIPAVANAIHDALGIRIDETPITPDRVLKALRQVARGDPGRIGPARVPDFDFGERTRVDPPAPAESPATVGTGAGP
jgi:4-hydroxybenzoyl-CoA reductase subunit alpha